MGMVFQQFNLFPHKTVIENMILAPVQLKKLTEPQAREKAQKLLERVGLGDRADSYPHPALRRAAAARGHRARAVHGPGRDAL